MNDAAKQETPAMSFDAFRARYEADNNEWWRSECGDHQNAFDEACLRLDAARATLGAVKALHFPSAASAAAVVWCDQDGFAWPCATIRAITPVAAAVGEPVPTEISPKEAVK